MCTRFSRVLLISPDANDDDDHVYMMFSATFPPQARKLAKSYLSKDHVRVRVGRAGSSHQNIKQHVRTLLVEFACHSHLLVGDLG